MKMLETYQVLVEGIKKEFILSNKLTHIWTNKEVEMFISLLFEY